MKLISLSFFLAFYCLLCPVQAQDSLDISSVLDCDCIDSVHHPVFLNHEDDGMTVLEVARQMVVEKAIVRGSCWDFVNEVFKRSGAASGKYTVFRSKKSGPFADPDLVKPGDWIYHVNLNYNNTEHSAIFICWKDFEKRIAITLSYAGMNKNQPGKYGTYNLSRIYSIFRPVVKEKSAPANDHFVNPAL